MPEGTSPQNAVIYCRVSSVSSQQQGTEEQEKCCYEFAKQKGYKVTARFSDIGQSGNDLNRLGLQNMLAFLKENQQKSYVVIVDTMQRLTTNKMMYFELLNMIEETGASLESIAPLVENTPENRFANSIIQFAEEYVEAKTNSN